jgi:hypothetical protein
VVNDWGFYRGMAVTYGATGLVAIMARLARGSRSPSIIAVTTLAGSCLFFLVTNFDSWANGSDYPHTAGGLFTCYTLAIPFFRNSLLGDFAYATILFGGWALAEARYPALRPASDPATR